MTHLGLIVLVVLSIWLLKRLGYFGALFPVTSLPIPEEIKAEAVTLVMIMQHGYSPIPRIQALFRQHDIHYVKRVCDAAQQIDPRIRITFTARPLIDQPD